MTSKIKGAGGDILVERNELARSGRAVRQFRDIVVFEDERLASDRLLATLRKMLGYDDIEVRRARTVSTGLDLLIARLPDLVLLDDYMGITDEDRAHNTLPLIRRAGFEGPVVVISGQLDRKRRNELIKLGVSEAINKDELDSGSLSKIMIDLARHLQEGTVKG